jgi:pimeloyl-ACP methyl ester carboxylesterase
MVYFWIATASIAVKLERLRSAEKALLDLAVQRSSKCQSMSSTTTVISTIDTIIPASVIPSSNAATATTITATSPCSTTGKTTTSETPFNVRHPTSTLHRDENDSLVIHAIEVTSDALGSSQHDKPLVLLHGYSTYYRDTPEYDGNRDCCPTQTCHVLIRLFCSPLLVNGGAYFYRNLMGLSRYVSKIYAIDQLGWGLSSRPNFPVPSKEHHDSALSIRRAEDFFVESLEAWRREQKIESMILAGHSMGGYLGVAYTERYPQHVERLILISPAGVPEETTALIEARRRRTTWRLRLFEFMFPLVSPGDLFRGLPESTARKWMTTYVTRRLPAITDRDEQVKLAEYLYANNALPGSGEYCLPSLLKPSIFGRQPLQHRIPHLKIKSCTFLYGDMDWMDPNGGLLVEQECAQLRLRGRAAPNVQVYSVENAGHLLMLDNVTEFNNGMVLAMGKGHLLTDDKPPLPTLLRPDQRQEVVAKHNGTLTEPDDMATPEAEAVY